ncbi:unnamed protein product [Wuchereria bancrofti]|uniref:Uncharacterized protein n=1 Tax=Wuchereria bancrofti TaxID=6293 RepID=A0A3P7DNP1_WUCBA|nr:unnamed protein product [Wuchereria bancrofti]
MIKSWLQRYFIVVKLKSSGDKAWTGDPLKVKCLDMEVFLDLTIMILMQCFTSWYAVRVGVNIGVLEKSIGTRRIKKHSLIVFASKMYSEQPLKYFSPDILKCKPSCSSDYNNF